MRLRRRYLVLACASVTALAVSGLAYASHISNTSALPTWSALTPANSNNLPGSGDGGVNGGTGTLGNAKLTIQTSSVYAHPNQPALGGKINNVDLWFDNDVVAYPLPASIPNCNATFTSSTTIAQAWEACGPGADVPASDPKPNAYLSPFSAVSGTISTSPPSNFPGCNLVFKKSATTVQLFVKATFTVNGTPNCASPATNSGGNTAVVLTGTLANATPKPSPDYNTRLRVPVPTSVPLALDNFKSTVTRSTAFRARCRDTNKVNHLRGTFTYSHPSQPPDTVVKGSLCQ